MEYRISFDRGSFAQINHVHCLRIPCEHAGVSVRLEVETGDDA